MNALLQAAVLSFLPISELRGGIPFAITMGVHPVLAYVVCCVANFLVVPVGYFFLNHVHKTFLRWPLYKRLFNKIIASKRGKLEKYIGGKWEFFALVLLVAIPLPVTGAYTGTLLAWFFGLDHKETYLALGIGVLIAGLIVSGLTLGVAAVVTS